MRIGLRSAAALLTATAFVHATAAVADLRLSELIVELQPGKNLREDVEVWNDSPDRAFVAAEPREIVNPGSGSQGNRLDPDPTTLGLLVSPSRMILEPGQRRLLRIAAVAATGEHEHVYRVTVKPVVGSVQSATSGVKILVGYDVLVVVRPSTVNPVVTGTRRGQSLTIVNSGNVSVELIEGRQCEPDRSRCSPLPGKRLYAGASWTTQLPKDGPAEFVLKSPRGTEHKTF
jgi:P pilus assembly chaperone PapD